MSDMKPMPDPAWKTVSATIPIRAHAGGFLAIELILPATIHELAALEPERSKTQFRVPVSFKGENFPPDTPCNVTWEATDGEKTLSVVGMLTQKDGKPYLIKSGANDCLAVLDLRSTGTEVGPLLERGGKVTLTLTPDYPHVHPATVDTDLGAATLVVSIAGKRLGDLTSLSPKIGETVQVSLARSGWDCHARLRIDTPGPDDLHVDWKTGEGERAWHVGVTEEGGALKLPEAPKKKKKSKPGDEAEPEILTFELLLEVSDDGTDYAPVHRGVVSIARPTLSGFQVRISPSGTGAKVHATGTLSGFVEGFDPPFGIELWAIAEGEAGKPRGMHRYSAGARDVPALVGGAFDVELAGVYYPGELEEIGRLTLFAVMRASTSGVPIESHLAPGTLRTFSDEDFTSKVADLALGICSGEATDQVTTRDLVLGTLRSEERKVDGQQFVRFFAEVHGPADAWKKLKPKFEVLELQLAADGATVHEATVTKLDAVYEPIKSRASGYLAASVSKSKLLGKTVKAVASLGPSKITSMNDGLASASMKF